LIQIRVNLGRQLKRLVRDALKPVVQKRFRRETVSEKKKPSLEPSKEEKEQTKLITLWYPIS